MQSANADKPITIGELRARSETLALNNTQDLPENRAAVLHMLASTYVEVGDWEPAARLVESALAALQRSSDQSLKSALTCGQAFISTHLGNPDIAMRGPCMMPAGSSSRRPHSTASRVSMRNSRPISCCG
jgi:hypothetical protein